MIAPNASEVTAPAPDQWTDVPYFEEEVYPHRALNNDADDHLFEPPPLLPTTAEVTARLVSLGVRVDAHVAERIAEEQAEIDEQQKKDDRAALNFLSDRLVATELQLELIDDALDHMHAGQQSPANVVGRLGAIITRIRQMNF
jgi:hypothetical protein